MSIFSIPLKYGVEARAENNFQLSQDLKSHYDLLRNEVFEDVLSLTPNQNMRFFVAAILHDLAEIEWLPCTRYRQGHSVSCNAEVRKQLQGVALGLSGGQGDTKAIKKIYEYVLTNINNKKEEGELPRFPYETLAESEGDCEDQAMLLAALLKLAGFESALIIINDYVQGFMHAFCIVRIDPHNTPGVLWKFSRYAEYGYCWKILDPAFGQSFEELPKWFDRYPGRHIPPEISELLIINKEEYEKLSVQNEKRQESPLLKEQVSREKIDASPAQIPPERLPLFTSGLDAVPYKIIDLEKINAEKNESGKSFITYGPADHRQLTNEEVISGVKTWEVMPDNISITVVEDAKRVFPTLPNGWKEEAQAKANEAGGTLIYADNFPLVYKHSLSEKAADVKFELDYYTIYITGRNRYANEEDLKRAAADVIRHFLNALGTESP